MEPLDLAGYQAEFAATGGLIWLAHSGVSPISRRAREAVDAFCRELETSAAAGVKQWGQTIEEVKRLTAELMHADPKDIAVTPNTTHGINLVAHGLDWRPGDQVVLATKEYPANVYPWWAQKDRGVELVWVEPDGMGRFPLEAYEAKLTDRTRVLAVSHVQFATGYRCDLAQLGTLCRERGIALVVDAIQSFSVFPVDVEAMKIDALTTGVHKWLCAPMSSGLFYTAPALRDRLRPTWVGANSVVNASDYLDYRFELLDNARRFENAMPNFPGIAGVRAALEIVHAFGRERIESRIREATDRILAMLEPLGFEVHSSRDEEEWSGILATTPPDKTPKEAMEALKGESIATTVRDNRLRLAPHAYHTEEQFERLGRALAELVERG